MNTMFGIILYALAFIGGYLVGRREERRQMQETMKRENLKFTKRR